MFFQMVSSIHHCVVLLLQTAATSVILCFLSSHRVSTDVGLSHIADDVEMAGAAGEIVLMVQ